jgi:pimeloyl-ACP methyl ester carboxylesterase
MRLVSSAGEALPAEIGERFKAHFGVDIVDGIGSTEMLHIFLSNLPDKVRYGTTGWPVPGYEVELRGDDGGPVPDGEPGDLYIHGPSAAMMYWGNRSKTRDTFQGGWTKSGDKYVRNADGSYTYGGRSDDMLKVSGIYVSPFEVEATLVQHPAVLEAAVIGVPDADGLTKTKAFVVLKAGAEATDDELKAFVKDKLAPYKYPRQIEFVNELPKTATGKIQRFKLREQEAAGPLSGAPGSSTSWRPAHAAHRTCLGGRRERAPQPLLVFLHEGLGSVSMWRDFPARLCDALDCRGLVYSRPGYGRSTPRAPGEAWGPDFMHHQAHEVLPALLACAGHRHRGTPALVVRPQRRRRRSRCCMRAHFPGRWPAQCVLAPHIRVEDVSVASIEQARQAYPTPTCASRLAAPRRPRLGLLGLERRLAAARFPRLETSSAEIGTITCPLLAVQGLDDEYGTLAQIRGIASSRPAHRAAGTARMRTFTAQRPAASGHRRCVWICSRSIALKYQPESAPALTCIGLSASLLKQTRRP